MCKIIVFHYKEASLICKLELVSDWDGEKETIVNIVYIQVCPWVFYHMQRKDELYGISVINYQILTRFPFKTEEKNLHVKVTSITLPQLVLLSQLVGLIYRTMCSSQIFAIQNWAVLRQVVASLMVSAKICYLNI